MSEKYDGWTVKAFDKQLLEWLFREKRGEVIEAFEEFVHEPWRRFRQRGTHKLVKIKLMEVK